MIEVQFQKALFLRLNAAKVALGVVGVYDTAPQSADGGKNAVFPYIVIGDIQAVQLDTQTKNGFTMNPRIHTYSRTGSMLQCKTIQGLIYGLLHRQPLTVTGFNAFEMLRNDTNCNTMQDGKVHGICEYIGLIEATASP